MIKKNNTFLLTYTIYIIEVTDVAQKRTLVFD